MQNDQTTAEPSAEQPEELRSRGRKLTPRTLRTRQRQKQAIDLRLAGYTLQAIADQLGYHSKGAVYEAIQSGLDRHSKAPADELRDQTVGRLDTLLTAIWPFALGIHPSQRPHNIPDLHYLDRVLAVEAQRARLLGLNAAEKIDVRALVWQLADAEGFTEDEKKDAVEFVEHHLRELRAS